VSAHSPPGQGAALHTKQPRSSTSHTRSDPPEHSRAGRLHSDEQFPHFAPSSQKRLAQLENPLQSRQPALSFWQVRSSPLRHSLAPSLGQRLSQRHSPEARSQYWRGEPRHESGSHRGPPLPASTPGASDLAASEAGFPASASKAGSAVGGARSSEQPAPQKLSKNTARESVRRADSGLAPKPLESATTSGVKCSPSPESAGLAGTLVGRGLLCRS
jgi:hypothetical protein